MSGQISRQEARRRVVQLGTFADGFWDMLLGGLFILLSIYPVTRGLLGPALNALLFMCLLALLIAVVGRARRIASIPRIGMVRPGHGPLTTVARITLTAVLLTLVVATLFMADAIRQPAIAGAPAWISKLDVDIFFAALIIGFFALFAHLTGVPRLHLYGWLIGLGNLASTILALYAGYTFGFPLAIAGLIILLAGVTRYRRFVRHYPVPSKDR